MRIISSMFTLLSRSAVMAFALSYSMTQHSLADSMYLTNGGQSFSFVSEFTTSGTYLGQFTNSLNNPAGIAQDPSGLWTHGTALSYSRWHRDHMEKGVTGIAQTRDHRRHELGVDRDLL